MRALLIMMTFMSQTYYAHAFSTQEADLNGYFDQKEACSDLVVKSAPTIVDREYYVNLSVPGIASEWSRVPGGGSTGTNAIAELPPGHWLKVGNSVLSTSGVCLTGVPGSTTNNCGGSYIYSGGAFDSTRNRLLVYGGGHNDYGGTEVYAFGLDDLEWTRIKDPYGYPTYTAEKKMFSEFTGGFSKYKHFANYNQANSWSETQRGSSIWEFDTTGYDVKNVIRTEKPLNSNNPALRVLYPQISYSDVTTPFRYYHDNVNGKLYLYAKSGDPTSAYGWVDDPKFSTDIQLYYSDSDYHRMRYFPDGVTPISAHTYRSLSYDPVNDVMWRIGAHSMYGNAGQGDSQNAYALSMDTLVWSRYSGVDIPTGGGQLTTYHDGKVYAYGVPTEAYPNFKLCEDDPTDSPDIGNSCAFLAAFDTTTKTSRRIPVNTRLVPGQYANMFVYPDKVSGHNLLMFVWWGGGSPKKNVHYYDLDQGSLPLTLVGLKNVAGNSGGMDWMSEAVNLPAAVYDPTTSGTGNHGPVVWNHNGINIYKATIDKAAGTVTWYKFTGLNSGVVPDDEPGLVGHSTGTYGRFQYSSKYNVFVLTNGHDKSVYVYKLPLVPAN